MSGKVDGLVLKFFVGQDFVKSAKELQVTVAKTFRGNLLDRETFAARAVRDGVRVGDLEAAFLQVLAVIEH